MMHDLRAVLRSIHARPGPSLVAVVCLALGIGVNLSLFGLIDTLTFRAPAGVDDPEGLVRVRLGASTSPVARGAGPTASYPSYERVAAERADLFDGLAAYGGGSGTREGGADARPVSFTIVTANYFSVLGVRPHRGRFFDPDGPSTGERTASVVLSYRYWRQSLGGADDVLGQALRINGVPLTVIGVAPSSFVGVDLGDTDMWIPVSLRRMPEFGGIELSASIGLYWLQLVGRLREGVTIERAMSMTTLEPQDLDLFTAQPVMDAGPSQLPISLLPLRTMFFSDQRGHNPIPLWSLAISGAVLLLVCATVANLLLAQAVRRRRETAIRMAIGGSPARIVRGQVLEGLVLASLALVVATVVAGMSIGLLRHLPIPPIGGVLTPRAIALGLALTVLTPLLVGTPPMLWTVRRHVGTMLREMGQHGVTSASRILRGFMVAQTAIGFVLLVLAGLFLKSLENVRRIDTGMDLDRVLMASVDGGSTIRSRPVDDIVDASLDRIRRIPSVEVAGVGNLIPFYLFSRSTFEIADGREDDAQPTSTLINAVGPDYLSAMGIGMASGRPIDASHVRGTSPVAIVSERLARRYWPSSSPLGTCLRLGGAFGDACVEVIGVARDTRLENLVGEPSEVLYLANAQLPPDERSSRIFIRTNGDRARVAATVRTELQSLDPEMPFVEVEPLDQRLRPQLLQWEVASSLFTSLGALAALLGAIGVYSVVSFSASQRSRELGIRSALGAGRGRLLGAELWTTLKVTVTGIAVGVVLGLVAARPYEEQLYGLFSRDASVYLSVGSLLAAIGLAAGLGPAWKAARADPAAVLREE